MRKTLGRSALIGFLVSLILAVAAVWAGDVRWFWTALIVFIPSFVMLVASADA